MGSKIALKNAQDQEFSILHNDNAGVVTLESDKIAVKNDTKKRRNYLINGNFQFWDYATSQTTNGYGSDNRWNNSNVGSTKTHSRMTSGDTERALFESPYYSRTVVSSIAGVNNYVNKLQLIEDVTKLAGKTVTLSFWAKADSAKSIAFKVMQVFGTGGAPSTYTQSNEQLINLTTTWQRKVITIQIPSLAGKILGTDGVHTSYTRLDFEFDQGGTFSYSGMVQQSGTFDIAEVKLEDGSVATAGWSPYDGEWGSESIARKRYFFSPKLGGTSLRSYTGTTSSTSTIIKFETQMRIIPSVTAVIEINDVPSVVTYHFIDNDFCTLVKEGINTAFVDVTAFTASAEL